MTLDILTKKTTLFTLCIKNRSLTIQKLQLAQSWKRKQSLAIFQTGWSLLGEACAVSRKFWLKYRCLLPSNLTEPAVTTSKVVCPWVACSVWKHKKRQKEKKIWFLDTASFNFRQDEINWLTHSRHFILHTMYRLAIECVNLEFTWWKGFKEFPQCVLSRNGIAIPNQGGFIQVKPGQVLSKKARYSLVTIVGKWV